MKQQLRQLSDRLLTIPALIGTTGIVVVVNAYIYSVVTQQYVFVVGQQGFCRWPRTSELLVGRPATNNN